MSRLSFHGNRRGVIRGLKRALASVIAADSKAQAAADAAGKVPLLFGAALAVNTALTTLLERCTLALAQRS